MWYCIFVSFQLVLWYKWGNILTLIVYGGNAYCLIALIHFCYYLSELYPSQPNDKLSHNLSNGQFHKL